MAAGGAEAAAAGGVVVVAGAEVAEVAVTEAAASRGELAAGARADGFPITLKANSSWPGSKKATRPMHVLLGRQAPATISGDDGGPTDVQRFREAFPNPRRQFQSLENARARVPGKLHALIS